MVSRAETITRPTPTGEACIDGLLSQAVGDPCTLLTSVVWTVTFRYERPGMGKNDALLVTLMIYMSTPEEGGQTEFPDAFGGKTLPDGGKGYRFQPKRGDLAVWWSCDKKGKQDMKSMHSAVPVKKGIKWNATRFLYDHTKVCGSEAATSIQIPKAWRWATLELPH